jgi:hypothetical protein
VTDDCVKMFLLILKKSAISIIFNLTALKWTAPQRLILKVQKPVEVPIFRPRSFDVAT